MPFISPCLLWLAHQLLEHSPCQHLLEQQDGELYGLLLLF